MGAEADRVGQSADLGSTGRALDISLGIAAVVPLLGCAGLALASVAPSIIVRTLAVIWSSCLLGFFAGVRRGLSFSEKRGAGLLELTSMLAIFAVAILSMLFCSPLIAAVGLAGVGVLDALAASRAEAPDYFTLFRPVQMAVATVALLTVQLHVG